jgi:hypothetical protein
MRNVLALLLLTAAVAANSAEPPKAGPASPAMDTGRPKTTAKPAAATSCGPSSAKAAEPAAASKGASTACTFDMGTAAVHDDAHADQKAKDAPADGGTTAKPRATPGTGAAAIPTQGKNKPPPGH